jgi:small-conductance mechanosensitive channel
MSWAWLVRLIRPGPVSPLASGLPCSAPSFSSGVRRPSSIPNEDIITHQVVNWSHKSDRVRLKVPVRVPHDSDLDQALALMREAASYPERVMAVPAPNALIMAFGETAIELELRFWIEDAQNGVHNIKSQVLYEIWRLFRQEGIQIPYPKRDLYVRSDLRT